MQKDSAKAKSELLEGLRAHAARTGLASVKELADQMEISPTLLRASFRGSVEVRTVVLAAVAACVPSLRRRVLRYLIAIHPLRRPYPLRSGKETRDA